MGKKHKIEIKFLKPKQKWPRSLFPSIQTACFSFTDEASIYNFRENFLVNGGEFRFISEERLEEDYEINHMYVLFTDASKYSLIKNRCLAFDGEENTGYWLQKIGSYLNYPFKKITNNWYQNPLSFHNSVLGSQFIMQDLLFTCNLYMYVSTQWYDAKYGIDSFTENNLLDFLEYVLRVQDEQFPVKVGRIF